MPSIKFSVQRWGCWPPTMATPSSAAPNLDFVPALMRRRLSPLAKAVFSAVADCVEPGEQIPLVCSSIHGEIQRTADILNEIGAHNGVSPTAFSLSVHNAIAGQLSIALKNCAPIVAVAPAQQGLLPALLEAIGLLNDSADEVMVALFDEPVPNLLAGFVPIVPDVQCLALRISRGGDNPQEQLLQLPASHIDAVSTISDLLQFLTDASALVLPLCAVDTSGNDPMAWVWRRHRG